MFPKIEKSKHAALLRKNRKSSHFETTGILPHLVAAELLLELVRHEALVVLEVLLDVHLELDDVVKHLLDLGVQLLAQGIRPERELFVSGKVALVKSVS